MSPSGKARVCKTLIRRFNSGRGLQPSLLRSFGRQGAVLHESRSLQNLLSDVFDLGFKDATRKVYLQGRGAALKTHAFPDSAVETGGR